MAAGFGISVLSWSATWRYGADALLASSRAKCGRNEGGDDTSSLVIDDNRDDDSDRDDAPGLTHLHPGGIQLQVRAVSFQWAVEEETDLLVDLIA